MHKISCGLLLSIHIFCSIQWFCYQTVKALIRLCRLAGWSGPLLPMYIWKHFCRSWPSWLTLKAPWKICSRRHSIFFYFSEKTSLDISCESSAKQTIHIKCKDLFSLKNKKKNYKKLSSAAVVIGALRVKSGDIVTSISYFFTLDIWMKVIFFPSLKYLHNQSKIGNPDRNRIPVICQNQICQKNWSQL